MEIALRVTMPGARHDTNNREAFWAEYRRLSRTERVSEDDPELSAVALEARVVSRFAGELSDSIRNRLGRQEYYEDGVSLRRGFRASPFATLLIAVTKIEYGSLDIFLKILGIEDAALLPMIAAALEIYAPGELDSILPGHDVPFIVAARPVDWTFIQKEPNEKSIAIGNQVTNEKLDAVRKLWTIANGSLVVPLLLSLVVLYFGFSAVLKEREELSKDRAVFSQERADFVKSLAQQSSAFSSAISEAIAGASQDVRELHRLELNFFRTHSEATGDAQRLVPVRGSEVHTVDPK